MNHPDEHGEYGTAHDQAFLRELLAALDAMPEKALIADTLEDQGSYCALGVICKARGMDVTELDPGFVSGVAAKLGASPDLVRVIAHVNDDGGLVDEDDPWAREPPEDRWVRMRHWVAEQIK
jgi:hypothetical protein